MTTVSAAGHAIVAAQALQAIPQNGALYLDMAADFIEVSYGYKRKVTINPNSAIRHIREFLASRITDDYLEDFVVYVTNYKNKEQERAEEGGGSEYLHTVARNKKGRKNLKLDRSVPARLSARKSAIGPEVEETPSTIVLAVDKPKKLVSVREAYDWVVARQSATLDKKMWSRLLDKNAEEELEEDCVEIIDFMTDQGELLCINTFENENMHHALSICGSKTLTRGTNTFFLTRVKLYCGEIREITPLVVNPILLQDLLPLTTSWLKQHVTAVRKKKEAMKKLMDAQSAPTQERRRKKQDK